MKKILSFSSKISDIYKVNYAMAFYYLIQLSLIIFIAKDYSLPISTSYITSDQLLVNANGNSVISSANSHLFDVNIKILIVILLVISIIMYGCLATIYRNHYVKYLKRQNNPIRWILSGISNGLILVLVGMLGGIYELSTLGIIFILPIMASVILLIEEQHKSLNQNSLSVWNKFSLVTAVIPLLIILCYVISAGIYGVKGIGMYYYFLYVTVSFLYLSSYINLYLKTKKFGLWEKYIYSEQVYQMLEIVLITVLIWQIFAGVLHS